MATETTTQPNTPTYQDPMAGAVTGTESSLSNWAGQYVTDMLGKGQALSNQPYYAYSGPLSAGPSDLQQQAWGGIAGLTIPDQNMASFTPQSFTDQGVSQRYMNPFVQNVLDPQLQELQRQAEIRRVQDAGRLTSAGAFGGSRQAIMESEMNRNLLDQISKTTGEGWRDAYTQGANQFNTEQRLGLDAAKLGQQYGLDVANLQRQAGADQRAITNEGITADYNQFREERDYPYKQVQFMQSLLQGLPLEAQNNQLIEPSTLSQILGGTGGVMSIFRDLGMTPGDIAGGIGDLWGTITGWFD